MREALKNNRLGDDAVDALTRCLEAVPFLRVRGWKGPAEAGEPDICVRLKSPKGETTLLAEVTASGQPRYARQAVAQLAHYLPRFKNAYGVFIAPYVSERSAAVCADAGIGYVDFAGNCRLSFDQVYVQKTGASNTHAEKRTLRSLYSPKATRVLRVWLNNAGRSWRIQDLAREAHVSLGQASNVKKLLDEREWVTSGIDGFRLTDPEALLVEWADNQNYRRDKSWQSYALDSSSDVEARLAQLCGLRKLKFALTGYSAANRLAPMVRTSRVSAYVDSDVEALMKDAGLKSVDSGANVLLIEPGDDGIFYSCQSVDNIPIASPVQVYLDLKRMGGRGDEAAEAVLNGVLRKRW